MDSVQFRFVVVRPVLEYLHPHVPYSAVAEELMMGTAAHESRLGRWLVQVDGDSDLFNRAIGVFQVERATHDDLWDRWLGRRTELAGKVRALASQRHPFEVDPAREMATNLAYAAAVARLVYYRSPLPLPSTAEPEALAAYWKRVYNTRLGRGDVERWIHDYRELVLGRV